MASTTSSPRSSFSSISSRDQLKLRNAESARQSRKRKQEYLDMLEARVTALNAELMALKQSKRSLRDSFRNTLSPAALAILGAVATKGENEVFEELRSVIGFVSPDQEEYFQTLISAVADNGDKARIEIQTIFDLTETVQFVTGSIEAMINDARIGILGEDQSARFANWLRERDTPAAFEQLLSRRAGSLRSVNFSPDLNRSKSSLLGEFHNLTVGMTSRNYKQLF
jgi:bZIP transcription factor